MNRVAYFLFSPLFALLMRFTLATVFTVAGVLKLDNPQAFADDIATFQILPQLAISPFALMLPSFEILLGLTLAFGWNKSAATLGFVLLSIIFTFALLQGILRGLSIDCGCFGSESSSKADNWLAFLRDILLLACSVFLYYRLQSPLKSHSQ